MRKCKESVFALLLEFISLKTHKNMEKTSNIEQHHFYGEVSLTKKLKSFSCLITILMDSVKLSREYLVYLNWIKTRLQSLWTR